MSRRTGLERGLRGAGVALLAAAFAIPFFAFGGRSVAWALLASAGGAALAGACLAASRLAGATSRPIPRAVVAACCGLVALSLLGLVPLPGRLLAGIAPVRARVQAAVPPDVRAWPEAIGGRGFSLGELLDETEAQAFAAADPDGVPAHATPASFDPPRTRAAIVVLAAFLLLALALGGEAREGWGRAALWPVLVLTAGGAVVGIVQRLGGTRLVYGRFEPPPGAVPRPYGPFWNENHFAGLCALLCGVAAGIVLCRAQRPLARLVAAACLIPLAGAVVHAGSRGGLLAAGTAALLLALGLLRAPATRRVGVLAVAVLVLAGAGLFVVGPERVIGESLEETTRLEASNLSRVRLYRRQVSMIASAPLVGTGLGAFETAQGPYQTTPESLLPHHGESDWLEVAAELGVGGWALWACLTLGLLGRPVLLALRGRAPVALVGLVAASLATLVHAAVDFHHREPSVGLASLLVAGTAAAWARRVDGVAAGGRRRTHLVVALAGITCLVLVVCVAERLVPHDVAMRRGDRWQAQHEWAAARDAALRATAAAPARAEGWALLARAHEGLARARGSEGEQHARAAVAACAEAVTRTPAATGAARRAAELLLSAGALAEARSAGALALVASPGHSGTREVVGELLLLEGRREEAFAHLAFAYEGVPAHHLSRHAPRLTRLLHAAAGGDAATVFDAVRSPPHRGWYLRSLHRLGGAEEIPAYFRLLLDEPVPRDARWLAFALGTAPGADSAALARRILPTLTGEPARTAAGRALLLSGELAEARAVAERLAAEPGAGAPAHGLLVDVLRQAGDTDAALAAARRGLEAHPNDRGLAAAVDALGGGGGS